MNAFHKRNFNLLVGTQQTGIHVSKNTEVGKRVSATESLLLLKSQTIFQSQTMRRYISINSRSTKNDIFVQSMKQPIMRTEDRLFDRGWVRSAMATRKCGNIYFPKYFMAVRPFFTRNCFQELFGLEGSKNLLENFVRCTI